LGAALTKNAEDTTHAGGLSSTAHVQVYVTDANDHAPVFYPLQYNISVLVSITRGAPLLVVSATDADLSARYSRLRYALVDDATDDGHRAFAIDETTGELYVGDSTLRETTYTMRVTARDVDGLEAHEAALVTVAVQATTTRSPAFHESFYRFTVREDIFPGIAVGKVEAMGQPPITYAIYSGDPLSLFAIDASTGVLSVADDLDADTGNGRHMLNVQCASGQPPVYNHTQVSGGTA